MTKLEKLKDKESKLMDRLYQEELRENKVIANRGWGYAQRNVKLGFSTRKSDELKERLRKVREEIKQINNN